MLETSADKVDVTREPSFGENMDSLTECLVAGNGRKWIEVIYDFLA